MQTSSPVVSASRPKVVVFGAAGGIGSATALAFLDRGCLVVGVDVMKPGTGVAEKENYAHILAEGGQHEPCTILEDVAQSGPISHVVTLTGGADPDETRVQDPLDLSPETFARSLERNLTNQFILAQAALQHLREGEGDRSLTLTSSINALAGISMFAYPAAKAGLIALGRALAVSEGKYGVRVNIVAPGTVSTERTRELYRNDSEHFDELARSTALGRISTAEEVGRTYVSAALDLTSVTGNTFIVDAGQLARWR